MGFIREEINFQEQAKLSLLTRLLHKRERCLQG